MDMDICRSLEKTQDCLQVSVSVSTCEQSPFVYFYGRKVRIIQRIIKIATAATQALNQKRLSDPPREKSSSHLSANGQLLSSLLHARAQTP
jgi:hypothetical protein